MDVFAINIADIADLATQVASVGAMAVSDWGGDEMFEMLVGVAALIYEMYPD